MKSCPILPGSGRDLTCATGAACGDKWFGLGPSIILDRLELMSLLGCMQQLRNHAWVGKSKWLVCGRYMNKNKREESRAGQRKVKPHVELVPCRSLIYVSGRIHVSHLSLAYAPLFFPTPNFPFFSPALVPCFCPGQKDVYAPSSDPSVSRESKV